MNSSVSRNSHSLFHTPSSPQLPSINDNALRHPAQPQEEQFECADVKWEPVQLLTTVSSLPAALRNALVHLIFLGFRFFLKFLWHFDLQNLNILKKGVIKKKNLSQIMLFMPHCKCDTKHWGYCNHTTHQKLYSASKCQYFHIFVNCCIFYFKH